MGSANKFEIVDDEDNLTTSEVRQLKKMVRQLEANQDRLRELLELSENVRTAKKTWSFILGLFAIGGGMAAWIGVDRLAAIAGFKKMGS